MRNEFCAQCRRHRLSVADVDGLCLYCRFPERQPQLVPVHDGPSDPLRCRACGGGPVTHRHRCAPCNREDARLARLRAKDR